MLFKFLFFFGSCVLMTNARCNLTADPLELIDCLSFMSKLILGLAKNDIQRVCQSASSIAKCAQSRIADCIGQTLGDGAFREIINLSENCCPDRNSPQCSIRDSLLRDQRCFAADSLITLSNGNQKPILDIKPGDSLLAYDHKTNNIISTNLLTMLDFQPLQFAFFKQIITTNGQQLSLSSSHLIPTDQHGYVMAKNLRIGMNVYIMNEKGVLVSDSISNISDVIKQGYVAPLTDAGTLIVNNVAASCYATINSHYVAHSVLAPMRWWYRFFGISKESNEMMIGVHWFPKMLYELTSYLIPSVIQN